MTNISTTVTVYTLLQETTADASSDSLNNKISFLFCSKAAQLALLRKKDKNVAVKEVYVAYNHVQ